MATNDINRMKELNELLAKAADAYYNTGVEIMSDKQYDDLYDELAALEKKTGVILSGSRTQQVGFEVSSGLKKIKHPSKMLSLDKTKSVEELKSWLGEHKGFLSWKLDGLTLVLTYEGGELVQAVTRGNGEIGEDITQNARHIKGIPARIPFTGRLVVRGESLMKYKDFERINAEIDDGSKYKNPRNLCVGTVRNLDSRVTAERNINFFAFNLVSAEGYEENSFSARLDWLEQQGFQRVYGITVTSDTVEGAVADFEKAIADKLGVNRGSIRRRLLQAGVVCRGRSESMYVRMSRLTPEERQALTRAAHDAVRGKKRSSEDLVKRAKSREWGIPNLPGYERDIFEEFVRRDIDFIPQKAVGKYNLDFLVFGRIAFEVFGGGWHFYGAHAQRFRSRDKFIRDSGYIPVYCVVMREGLDAGAVCDYLVSLFEILSSDPASTSEQYVIRGDGQSFPLSRFKFHDIA